MSLKEIMEKERMQQAEAAKTEEYYRKMYEAVGAVDVVYHNSYQHSYKETFPVELSPEHQVLIEEFIEMCPPKAWIRLSDKVDRAAASCDWDSRGMLCAKYRSQDFFGQVKLPDGTVHIARYEPKLDLELGECWDLVKQRRFFLKAQKTEEEKVRRAGLERVLQEMQQRFDRYHKFQYGAGEYVRMDYIYPHSEYDEKFTVLLFRDGTMYEYIKPYDHIRQQYAPFLRNKDTFEKWLISYLKNNS